MITESPMIEHPITAISPNRKFLRRTVQILLAGSAGLKLARWLARSAHPTGDEGLGGGEVQPGDDALDGREGAVGDEDGLPDRSREDEGRELVVEHQLRALGSHRLGGRRRLGVLCAERPAPPAHLPRGAV